MCNDISYRHVCEHKIYDLHAISSGWMMIKLVRAEALLAVRAARAKESFIL